MSERLAWAKAHNVTLPGCVLAAAREAAHQSADDHACGGCCCHCKKAAVAKAAENTRSPAGGYVIAIKALECQGGPLGLLKTVPVLIPAAADFSRQPLLPSGTLFFCTRKLRTIFAEVPVPPPRG